MKKIILLVGLCSIFIIASSITRDEKLYYWSNGEKIYLSVDKNSILGKAKPGTDLQALADKVQKATTWM